MKVPRILIVALVCPLLLMLPLPAAAGGQMATPPDSNRTAVEQWSQTFGASDHDQGNSVAQTSDGGYIIAGQTYSYGAGLNDVYLIKTDSSGNEEWYQTFGGTEQDYGKSVAQTSDGGYIIGGYTYSFASYCDFYLIKTDANGNEEWSQTFGGFGANFGYSVAVCSDGGYVIVGDTSSHGAGSYDAWLIKTDADGIQEWSQTFGTSNDDYGRSVAQTSDGGYVITGYTFSYGDGSANAWLIKTDASGNEEWNEIFGGVSGDYGNSVAQTSDGGYVIAGDSYSFGGTGEVYLVKTDASGNEVWSNTFGGEYASDAGHSVAVTPDGGYIIAGTTYSYGPGYGKMWLIKTDASGNEEWNEYFGGSNYEDGLSVAVTSDGGYICAGDTGSYGAGGSDVWLVKVGESDTTPPTVASTSPASGATGVSLDTVAIATFSEAMDAATITTGSFTVAGVSGSVAYDSGSYTATFTPAADLAYETAYTASLSTAVTDSAGNPLASTYSWSFTTESEPPETVTVSIDAPDEAAPDSDFTVSIDISDVTDFDSCNYDITFDATVLRLDNVAAGLIGSTTVPVDMHNELSSGTYRVIQNVPGLSGATGSGYLAVLHFHVIGSEGDSSSISLSNGVLSDNQAEEITATWAGDSIDITSVVLGDGNGDGTVNALDITKVERVIVGMDAETAGADANSDGVVNALDITKIELIIAGLG
jgi:hypothetical protein